MTPKSTPLPVREGVGVVYGLYVPNAPNLIAPAEFGGVGAETVAAMRGLDVTDRVWPDVVIVSTPHFVTRGTFLVQASPQPPQLHDYGGMPELNKFRYGPPGDPELARRLVEEGKRAGLPVETTTEWGLDHGAWAPLMSLFPKADIPTVPISTTELSPKLHAAWGEAIARSVRAAGRRAVFVGTGSILHRLDRANFDDPKAYWSEGAHLEREVVDATLSGGLAGLESIGHATWRKLAPEGNLAPLFTLLGAVGHGFRGREVATGQAFGAAGMTILEFIPRSSEEQSRGPSTE